MLASKLFLGALLFSAVGVLGLGCSSTVTSVGAIEEDSGSATTPPPSSGDGGSSGGDGSVVTDASPDAVDAHADGPVTCPAGECGARVCGRDECGHVCGVCAGAPAQGGCFMGKCTQTCPGTPCLDHDGHHICEGERGGRSCAGGALHIQVCTCSGGGANGWINCGACL